MEDGLTESEPGRKPSNSAKSTHKCAPALRNYTKRGPGYSRSRETMMLSKEIDVN